MKDAESLFNFLIEDNGFEISRREYRIHKSVVTYTSGKIKVMSISFGQSSDVEIGISHKLFSSGRIFGLTILRYILSEGNSKYEMTPNEQLIYLREHIAEIVTYMMSKDVPLLYEELRQAYIEMHDLYYHQKKLR